MKARVPKFTRATCPKCQKPATIIQRIDMLNDDMQPTNDIQHTYFKCGECGHVATVMYTDSAIREMLSAQEKLYLSDKDKAAENIPKIQDAMDRLRERVEGLA